MEVFKPIWYTIPEFADVVALSLYHKEQEAVTVKNNGISNLHVLARSDFLAKANKSYRLYITADDYYKLYINGAYVTQGPAPAYPEAYYYNTVELDNYLNPGRNVIAVHLYYQGLLNRVCNSGDNRFGIATGIQERMPEQVETPEKMYELKWRYRISDAYDGGTTGYDTQFLENFDARKWEHNWNTLEYKERGFREMVVAKWADYKLIPQPTKQLALYPAEPICLEKKPEGLFVDMGEELTGMLCIRARGRAGCKVVIRCGEELDASGGVRYQMRCNCTYEETWTLDEGENFLEQYDYKAFRYVWLGFEAPVEVEKLWVQVRHYPMEEQACMFTCSDKRLEQIFSICKNAVKYGTQEGYLDCPTREKGQYLGDAIITAHAQVWLTGSVDMLRKCIAQFAQTADICPGLMGVAPGGLMQEIADFSLLFGELLLLDYQFTEDKEFLRKYYPVAKGIADYFKQYERADGLLCQVADKWNLVDWPENIRDGYDFTLSRPVVAEGCHNVINALYIGAIKNLERMETLLEFPVSCDSEKRKEAFVRTFFREKTALFADSEESMHSAVHSNVYALYFGLVPKAYERKVADFLVKSGLRCGVFVSYFFLKALARVGRYEDVYRLLVNETEHGWVNMLREGATTCFEAWGKDQKWNTSLCHPWASAPIVIIIEDIAGFFTEEHIPKEVTEFCLQVPYRGKMHRIEKKERER